MRHFVGTFFLLAFSPLILAGFLIATAWDAALFGADLFRMTDEWIMGDEE